MSGTTYNESVGSVLDYAVDWTSWLENLETISTSDWVLDTGLVAESSTVIGNKAVVFLSGGTFGLQYSVCNTITTSQGRTDSRYFNIHFIHKSS